MRLRRRPAPDTEFEWLFDDGDPEDGRALEIAEPHDRGSTIGEPDRHSSLSGVGMGPRVDSGARRRAPSDSSSASSRPAPDPERSDREPSSWGRRPMTWLAAAPALLVLLVIVLWPRGERAGPRRSAPPISATANPPRAVPSRGQLARPPVSLRPSSGQLTRAGRPHPRRRRSRGVRRLHVSGATPPRPVQRPRIRTVVVQPWRPGPDQPTSAPAHPAASAGSTPGGGLAFGR